MSVSGGSYGILVNGGNAISFNGGATSFTLASNHNITVDVSGTVLETNFANNLTFTLGASGSTGTFTVSNGASVQANTGLITVNANNFNYTGGTLSTGTAGSITITPLTAATAMQVGDTAGPTGFDLTDADMANTTTGTLTIGGGVATRQLHCTWWCYV